MRGQNSVLIDPTRQLLSASIQSSTSNLLNGPGLRHLNNFFLQQSSQLQDSPALSPGGRSQSRGGESFEFTDHDRPILSEELEVPRLTNHMSRPQLS
jgi:hypothetical protein